MSQDTKVMTEVEATDHQETSKSIDSNHSRSNENRTSEPSEMSQMQNKIKNIEALIVDINNKFNASQSPVVPEQKMEYGAKTDEQIDARTKALKHEWNL